MQASQSGNAVAPIGAATRPLAHVATEASSIILAGFDPITLHDIPTVWHPYPSVSTFQESHFEQPRHLQPGQLEHTITDILHANGHFIP